MIPKIKLEGVHPQDDFAKLAETLNHLTARIRQQIDTLTRARNEKVLILEALNEGVVLVTDSLVVTYANQTAQTLLDIQEKQPFSNETSCKQLLIKAQESQEQLTDLLILEGQSRTFLQLVAIPLKEKGAILVLQDLSSHYQAMQMTKDFVANASHELKTPITVIQGFSEMLHDYPELPPEKTKEITAKIVRNSIRMNTLIQDLLHLSEMENIQRIDLDECNLVQVLEHCKEMVLEVYPTATITIAGIEEAPFILLSNEKLLEHLFLNLLSNGAKYSKDSANIEIKVAKTHKDICVSITDQGIGIPKDDLPHLFTRFYTVDKAHSKAVGGTGLGLAIVETIIEKSGGTISVESEVDKGTTFSVTLPGLLC